MNPSTPNTPNAPHAASPPSRTADAATITGRFGPFSIISYDDIVLASGWTTELEALCAVISPQLRPPKLRVRRDLGAVTRSVQAYDGGDLDAIDDIEVQQRSGPFREQVWQTLRAIPAGVALTYSEVAAKAGSPRAVRAAGSACATNPSALFVPCHRVIGSNGALRGFGYGLQLKAALLAHESRDPSDP